MLPADLTIVCRNSR